MKRIVLSVLAITLLLVAPARAKEGSKKCDTVTIDSIDYSIDKCVIEVTLLKDGRDTSVSVTVTPSKVSLYTLVLPSVVEGDIPRYSIMSEMGSCGATREKTFEIKFINKKFSSGASGTAKDYTSHVGLRVSHYSPTESRFEKLNINFIVHVKP